MNGTIFNAASGIKTHQFGLDSISNNIANVNTTGYRENMPEFKSLFNSSLNTTNANSPTNNDYNYGTTKGSNAISTKSGSYKQGDGEFNMAYQGRGWFVTGKDKNGSFTISKDGYSASQENYFTRDGTFTRDGDGYIVSSEGAYLYGVNLGKINNGTFTSQYDSDIDTRALAGGKLEPLHIPQELYYSPVLTTKINIATNINKTEYRENVVKFFKDKNGEFDEERFLSTDLNAFATNDETIEASTYNEFKVTIIKNGKKETQTFKYGIGGAENNEFITLNDLRSLLDKKAGLQLGLLKDADGKVSHSVTLEIKNATFQNMDLQISGSLADKLGLSGRDNSFDSGIGIGYSEDKQYNAGEKIAFNGIIFEKIGEPSNKNPIQDLEQGGNQWKILDTQGLENYKDNTTYKANEIISHNGKIYKKLVDGSETPNGSDSAWQMLGDSAKIRPESYSPDKTYAINDIVNKDGNLYKKILSSGSTDPSEDKVGWHILRGKYFSSTSFQIPTYKASSEIYDNAGKKYILLSEFYLQSAGDKLNDPTFQNEFWEVRSAIYDHTGNIMVSPEKVIHHISFDEDGNPTADKIKLKFGDGEVEYDITQSDTHKSSNHLYRDSAILSTKQDGRREGHLKDVRIDKNGIIFLAFTNGAYEPMGRVGITAFVNDQGLQKVGGNKFKMVENTFQGESRLTSGKPLLGWDEESGTMRFGQILHKYIETSNVDIGNSLTDLIVTQRGYSMNAKAFTTGDELLREAIALKK